MTDEKEAKCEGIVQDEGSRCDEKTHRVRNLPWWTYAIFAPAGCPLLWNRECLELASEILDKIEENYAKEVEDQAVKRALEVLERGITQSDLHSIEFHLCRQGLSQAWDRATDRSTWFPVIGERWSNWLQGLSLRCLPQLPALSLMADAGVLGEGCSKAVQERVLKAKGWS